MVTRAVLFDLDCTLTDRRRSIERAGRRLAELYPKCGRGRGACDDVIAAMWAADYWGYRDRRTFFAEVVERLNWTDAPPTDELLRFWREDYPGCTVAVDGVDAMLDALRGRGVRLGIVTNGDSSTQNRKVDVLDLRDRVDAVVVSGDVGLKKPDRRIYELALERVGVTDPGGAVFVGDHPVNDIHGAAQLGMRTVWIKGACAWVDGATAPSATVDTVTQALSHLTGAGPATSLTG